MIRVLHVRVIFFMLLGVSKRVWRLHFNRNPNYSFKHDSPVNTFAGAARFLSEVWVEKHVHIHQISENVISDRPVNLFFEVAEHTDKIRLSRYNSSLVTDRSSPELGETTAI